MDYRLATILARQQYTADKTEPIKIDLTQPISRIVITYEPDNNPSGANATAHPIRCLKQITLDNGSDILYALDGASGQGVDFYDRNKVTPSIMCYLNGMYSEMIVNINFGNYLYDPKWALLPEMFKNLYLNITLDIDAGGDEPNDGYLTVLAHIFDQKSISPSGFIMTKEEKEYTLVSSGNERTYLPTDHPYKQLFVRAQRYGTGPEHQIDTVKLSENNDERIPVDFTFLQLIRNIAQEWTPYEENILVHGTTTAQHFYNTPCYRPRFTDTQWRSAVATAEASIYSGDGGRFQHDAEAAGPNHQVHCRGWLPHAVLPVLPKPSIDIEEQVNFSGVKSLRLDVKGGSSVGTSQLAQIITQQYRGY